MFKPLVATSYKNFENLAFSLKTTLFFDFEEINMVATSQALPLAPQDPKKIVSFPPPLLKPSLPRF